MADKPMTDFEHQCLAALVAEHGITNVIVAAVNIHVFQKEEAEDADEDQTCVDRQTHVDRLRRRGHGCQS